MAQLMATCQKNKISLRKYSFSPLTKKRIVYFEIIELLRALLAQLIVTGQKNKISL